MFICPVVSEKSTYTDKQNCASDVRYVSLLVYNCNVFLGGNAEMKIQVQENLEVRLLTLWWLFSDGFQTAL